MILEEYDILNNESEKLKALEVILRALKTDIGHENYELNLDVTMEFLADQLSSSTENIDEMLNSFRQKNYS